MQFVSERSSHTLVVAIFIDWSSGWWLADSGLLECPLTTRIEKIYDSGNGGFNDSFSAKIFECGTSSPQCRVVVSTAAACFSSVKALPTFGNSTLPTKTVEDPATPPGCSVQFSAGKPTGIVFNTNAKSTACCSAPEIVGSTQSLVKIDVTLSESESLAHVTVTGPSTVWFGVGFGSSLMPNTYAVVIAGNGSVSEHLLGDHAAGTVLAPSVTVVSNTVSGTQRTVKFSRPLKGLTKTHYSFNATNLALDLINAVGAGPDFAYHKASTATSLNLVPAQDGTVCVCSLPAPAFGQASGKIKYLPSGEAVGFQANRCAPQPREDLLAQRNPTCDLRTCKSRLLWNV